MTRLLLAAVAACLLLLAWSRLDTPTVAPAMAPDREVAPPSTAAVPAATPAPVLEPPGSVDPLDAPGRTPTIARMARLEGRRRLQLSGASTYLDSLWQNGDTTVRRWADGRMIRVAVAAGPEQLAPVRAAWDAWNALRIGVGFVAIADSAVADIVVDFIDQFPGAVDPSGETGRTGLTAVRSGQTGEIRRAQITLALLDAAGRPLTPDQIRAIAMHELGHALGLPHSGSARDIMHEIVVAKGISERDRASAALLYSLPPGSLQDEPRPPTDNGGR